MSPSTEGDDRAPAPARPASTVIVLRDGARGGIETFMVRRDPQSRFAADAFVFPGGTVHADDWLPGGVAPCPGLTRADAHQRLRERGGDAPDDPGLSFALYVAAVRELYEEAGILLARPRSEPPDAHLDQRTCDLLAARRPALQQGVTSLAAVASDLRLTLTPEELIYFSHWITPLASPRRYDTRFFVVDDRPGQVASHCGVETVDGRWLAPAEALGLCRDGVITLVSVTIEHLRVLAMHQTVTSALEYARRKPIRTVMARRHGSEWDIGGSVPW